VKTDSKIRILAESPLFRDLSEDALDELSKLAIERNLIPGEFLFFENDLPGHFYVLVKGRIKSFVNSSSGKEFILAFLRPGEILGPVSILSRKPTTGSMRAVAQTKVLGFRRDDFVLFLLRNPELSFELIKILSARISEFSLRLRDLAGERVDQRIIRILYMLSSRLGLDLPFTRQELAEMVGTTTETTIRVLCDLKRDGIIESGRGRIIILNLTKLKTLIEKSVETPADNSIV
jgi:CRP/FNR family transcriptional regulator